MTYVMSDIHGCYEHYIAMLKKINLRDSDVLYVLGDVVDRGPKPVEVLRDMSMRPNVIPIMGNHEFVAHYIMKQLLLQEVTEENIVKLFGSGIDMAKFLQDIEAWTNDGGGITMKEFAKLPNSERADLIDYIEEFSMYEIVTAGGNNFILTHSGLPEGATQTNLDNFDQYDIVMADTDYSKEYFPDTFLVTGHVPTFIIDRSYYGIIYCKNNHIAIDTGVWYAQESGRLGCMCLDTFEEFYV